MFLARFGKFGDLCLITQVFNSKISQTTKFAGEKKEGCWTKRELTFAYSFFLPNSELISAEMVIRQQKSTRNMNSTIVWLKNAKKTSNCLFYYFTVLICHPISISNGTEYY